MLKVTLADRKTGEGVSFADSGLIENELKKMYVKFCSQMTSAPSKSELKRAMQEHGVVAIFETMADDSSIGAIKLDV